MNSKGKLQNISNKLKMEAKYLWDAMSATLGKLIALNIREKCLKTVTSVCTLIN